MKVSEIIEALKKAPQDSEVVMSDLLPVQSLDIDGEGRIVLSDEEHWPPKRKKSTVVVKFALDGIDPQEFAYHIQRESGARNLGVSGGTVTVVYSSVTFDPLTDSEDDVACYAARQLLMNSLADIDYDYNHLTAGEKKYVTRAQFEALLRQFKMGK